jgi:prepilin-type N-terminal cleavage/methylation domain-containing protein
MSRNRERRLARRADPRQQGFSLLELVVVVAVLSIVMGAAFQLMNRSQSSFDRNQMLAEAHQNAEFAVTRVTELIRGAGANPENVSTINAIAGAVNREVGASTDSYSVIRLRSDLNGDRDVADRVDPSVVTAAEYFLLSSEDVTLKHLPNGDTSRGIEPRTIVLIDNTPGDNQGVPFVLAEHIVSFDCRVNTAQNQVTLELVAGPNRNIDSSDPRWATFTRRMQIRMRNR